MKLNLARCVRWGVVGLAFAVAWFLWQSAGFGQPGASISQPLGRQGLTWTRVPSNSDVIITASKVIGGWFIFVYNPGDRPDGAGTLASSFFYMDQNHQWDGKSLP